MHFNKSQSNPHYVESALCFKTGINNMWLSSQGCFSTASKPYQNLPLILMHSSVKFPIQTSQTNKTCPYGLGVVEKVRNILLYCEFHKELQNVHHCASLAISQILFYLWPGSLLQSMKYHIFAAIDNSESLLLIHLSHRLQQIISSCFYIITCFIMSCLLSAYFNILGYFQLLALGHNTYSILKMQQKISSESCSSHYSKTIFIFAGRCSLVAQ